MIQTLEEHLVQRDDTMHTLPWRPRYDDDLRDKTLQRGGTDGQDLGGVGATCATSPREPVADSRVLTRTCRESDR